MLSRKNTLAAVLAAALLAGAGAAAAAEGERSASDRAAADRARGLLAAHPQALGAGGADTWSLRDVIVDADGSEHVRFDRRWQGLPVIGGDIVVHSRDGVLRDVSATLAAPLALSAKPGIGADLARGRALAATGAGFVAGAPQLVVHARGGQPPRLAWQVPASGGEQELVLIVDAHSGALLDRWSARHTASATGSARTLYSGEVTLRTRLAQGVYSLRDPKRGGMETIDGSNSRTSGSLYTDADNVWGDFSTDDPATVATDAQYGAAMTWDYFKKRFGRLGIAGDGVGARSRVHYGRNYMNAFWNDACFCMTYGDGDGVFIGPLVSLDIAAHEMSHGVTSRTAGLIYSGESGALNEATSDIFAAMVEFHANNPVDPPDYMIGEQIVLANVPGSPDQLALRYLFDPAADGVSRNCWSADVADLDVHLSSGIGNRFFYLLAEGSGARTYAGVDHKARTCDGTKVKGIGRNRAAQIWYRALTVYFTSDTDYAGARVATLQAAADLYGDDSREVAAVAEAWNAVAVP
ncbi:M4 family metallopeptidase [Arenimonas composti]|uniref:Neutral metalloproteinase n=1 Tax=Arenimonas composti TR7-09 = DSM 18010 TaxID=1121013 RepID=A0A091BH63_9GAMM|nr:M4 family metallopeptidase [Arenimonas composti]KFN50129.1 hypothetical protein P873_08115 [Arenimonas composti TR7-09 = DSM 18010]